MAKKSTQLGIRKQTKSVKKNVLTSDNINVNLKKKKIKGLKYNQDNVKKALKAVKETGISLRKAAAAFGIPGATLARKKNLDPEKTKSKTGPGTVLSNDEEDSIAKWVLHRAEIEAPLKEIFTPPVEYLPKKKRSRVEKSGKSKLPSVGTSDEWYTLQLEKENLKKQQEEKKQKKKQSLEKKKKLMEKVKELQKRMKEKK